MTIPKKVLRAWEIGRRVEASFPEQLTAAAIRSIVEASRRATTEDEIAEAACAMEMLVEKAVCVAGDYANYVLTPTAFANLRRKNGDPSAAAADYDCGCSVRDPDGVPICVGVRQGCKFAGLRRSENALPNDITGLNRAWFDTHQYFRRLLAPLLSPADPERMARCIAEMEAALKRANARRKRSGNKEFKRAVTAFYA